MKSTNRKHKREWLKVKRVSFNSNRRRHIKSKLHVKQSGLCNICRRHLSINDATIDHRIPISRGGVNAQRNLQLLCYDCNVNKGSKIS
ncbi:MAG: HNH endonuclease [Candidatus Poribacteria bacterium]|nr:HNH endonuclease [Candidatus Poribacteria bacterium]